MTFLPDSGGRNPAAEEVHRASVRKVKGERK